MSANYEEDAQVEALRRWWSENWKALVFGLALGLAGIFGWQAWNRHKAAHRLQAATVYGDLEQSMKGDKNADVKSLADQLVHQFDDTPYAAEAQFKLAQADVTHGRFDDAATRLQWVADHGNDAGVRAIATLRLAAVRWQLGKSDQALALLRQPPAGFAGLYDGLRGDILIGENKPADARKAYQQALAALPAESTERDGITQKLESLAGGSADEGQS